MRSMAQIKRKYVLKPVQNLFKTKRCNTGNQKRAAFYIALKSTESALSAYSGSRQAIAKYIYLSQLLEELPSP